MELQKGKKQKKQNLQLKHINRHYTHFNTPIQDFNFLPGSDFSQCEDIPQSYFAKDQILLNLKLISAKPIDATSNLRIKLSQKDMKTGGKQLIGRTEIIRNNVNANFQKQFLLTIDPFKQSQLLFDVYDLDCDYVERSDSLIATHEEDIQSIINAILDKSQSIEINFKDKPDNAKSSIIIFITQKIEQQDIKIVNFGIDRIPHIASSEINQDLKYTISAANPEKKGCFLLKSELQNGQKIQHFYMTQYSPDEFNSKLQGIIKSCNYDLNNGIELNVFLLIIKRITSRGKIEFFTKIRSMYFEQTSTVKLFPIDDHDIKGFDSHVSNQKMAEQKFGLPSQSKTFHFTHKDRIYQLQQAQSEKLQKIIILQKFMKKKVTYELFNSTITYSHLTQQGFKQIEGILTGIIKFKVVTLVIKTVTNTLVQFQDVLQIDSTLFKSFGSQQNILTTIIGIINVKVENGKEILYFSCDDQSEFELLKSKPII